MADTLVDQIIRYDSAAVLACRNARIPVEALETGAIEDLIDAVRLREMCAPSFWDIDTRIRNVREVLAELKESPPKDADPKKRSKNYCAYCEIEHAGGC